MIFVQGYVHCDPHPGNVLVNKTDEGTQIVLLDHGLYQVHFFFFLSHTVTLAYDNIAIFIVSGLFLLFFSLSVIFLA